MQLLDQEKQNILQKINKDFGEIYFNEITNRYELHVFDGIISKYNRSNFISTFKSYYEILKIVDSQPEEIVNISIKGNKLYFKLKTNDNQIFETKMESYKRIVNGRNKFNQLVANNGHKLLSIFIGKEQKVLIDYCCGHKPNWVNSHSYESGVRCPYCSHQKISNEDDVFTCRPDLLPYFLNIKDAKNLAIHSSRNMNFKCPNCGYIKQYRISAFTKLGFSCPRCSDGVSYPQKFMLNLLDNLHISFETEKSFEWSKYNIDNQWHTGYYDFVIEDKKIIIEMDGKFHYEDLLGDLNLTQEKDNYKTKLAIENGYNIIRIDCNYDNNLNRYNYIKNNIIKSCSDIFDLQNIFWDDIDKRCQKSLLLEVCKMWNQGYMSHDIIKKLHTNTSTIIQYLKRGNKYGFCNYSKEESYKRRSEYALRKNYIYCIAYKNNEIVGVFWHTNIFCDNYNAKINPERKLKQENIRRVLTGFQHTTCDLTFKEISYEEYLLKLQLENIITDNGLGIKYNKENNIEP